MKKHLILLTIALMTFLSCGKSSSKTSENDVADDITQVLYFHTKKRCITCNAIERLSKEVVDSLANEKIVMRIIDITEDEVMADKYEVTWSSLILDRGGNVNNLTDMGFGYAKNNPEAFKSKLLEAIDNIKK